MQLLNFVKDADVERRRDEQVIEAMKQTATDLEATLNAERKEKQIIK